MYEITDRTSLPYSTICYIICEWPDGSATRASGVVVGTNDVLTADHVIFDADRGGYAAQITVYPGADSSPLRAPFGSYSDVAVIYSRTGNWDSDGDNLLTSAESQSDMALLGLKTRIGNDVGITPVASDDSNVTGTMDGYPARGTGLMEEGVTATASPFWSVYDIDANLGPGASGGPLLRDTGGVPTVVGVLSSGDPELTHSTYAGLYGSNWQWLQDSMHADDTVMTGAQLPASGSFSGAASGVVTYLGTTAADAFHSTWLNEAYLGRGGADSVIFSGNRADYRLAHAGSDVVVNDSVATRDGSDTLTDMTHAVFADMSVNLLVGAHARGIASADLKMLEELYVGFFNRVPEADGLDFWIGQVHTGHSVTQVADSFYSAALGYPALTGYSSTMSSADFVNVVYRNVLGRADGADAGGLQFWTDALAHGTSRGTLVESILQSAHTFKGNATWGWVADLLDNKAAVAQQFAVTMGLGYITPEASIQHGMEIAAAVTPTSIAGAIALIGVTDPFITGP